VYQTTPPQAMVARTPLPRFARSRRAATRVRAMHAPPHPCRLRGPATVHERLASL